MTTIRDIAREAGVSTSTVSRALAGSSRISQATIDHVNAVAKRLGYQRNVIAAAMKTGRTGLLGLITGDIENPFFSSLANRVEAAARKHGYALTVVNGHEIAQRQVDAAQILVRQQVDGAIIVPAGELDAKALEPLGSTIPTIAIDRIIDSTTIPSFVSDASKAVKQLISNLVKSGFRRLGIITGPQNTSTGKVRHQLLKAEAQRQGLDVVVEVESEYNHLQAREKAMAFFDFPSGGRTEAGDTKVDLGSNESTSNAGKSSPQLLVDAIVCGSSMLALGVMELCNHHKITIGRDIGFATFDDVYWFQCVNPTLSVIDSMSNMVERSTEEIIAWIESGTPHYSTDLTNNCYALPNNNYAEFLASSQVHVVSEARYIERESTRALVNRPTHS